MVHLLLQSVPRRAAPPPLFHGYFDGLDEGASRRMKEKIEDLLAP